MSVYYNEIEPYAADWLENLISAGHLPAGEVDRRSIVEVTPDDLRPFRQAHFFAGIGGWPYALRLAGWPDDREVWTGSCPCQPLSSAGQRKGHADERHLWPAFHSLIAERRPATVFGEQVASKDGREWLAGVRADLERLGYACGCADLPAAGVSAPHIRQRLWWVGYANCAGRQARNAIAVREQARPKRPEKSGPTGGLADDLCPGPQGRVSRRPDAQREDINGHAGCNGATGFWSDFDLIPCADGKARRVESGTFPLAHGDTARVGRLRAYGNAIVPPLAAEFVMAFMECRP